MDCESLTRSLLMKEKDEQPPRANIGDKNNGMSAPSAILWMTPSWGLRWAHWREGSHPDSPGRLSSGQCKPPEVHQSQAQNPPPGLGAITSLSTG